LGLFLKLKEIGLLLKLKLDTFAIKTKKRTYLQKVKNKMGKKCNLKKRKMKQLKTIKWTKTNKLPK